MFRRTRGYTAAIGVWMCGDPQIRQSDDLAAAGSCPEEGSHGDERRLKTLSSVLQGNDRPLGGTILRFADGTSDTERIGCRQCAQLVGHVIPAWSVSVSIHLIGAAASMGEGQLSEARALWGFRAGTLLANAPGYAGVSPAFAFPSAPPPGRRDAGVPGSVPGDAGHDEP